MSAGGARTEGGGPEKSCRMASLHPMTTVTICRGEESAMDCTAGTTCWEFLSVVAESAMTSLGAEALKNGHFSIGMWALQQDREQVLAKVLPIIIWQ